MHYQRPLSKSLGRPLSAEREDNTWQRPLLHNLLPLIQMKGLRELEEVGVYLDFLGHSSYFFKGFFSLKIIN